MSPPYLNPPLPREGVVGGGACMALKNGCAGNDFPPPTPPEVGRGAEA